jgi:YVTN family beta-propeller protein
MDIPITVNKPTTALAKSMSTIFFSQMPNLMRLMTWGDLAFQIRPTERKWGPLIHMVLMTDSDDRRFVVSKGFPLLRVLACYCMLIALSLAAAGVVAGQVRSIDTSSREAGKPVQPPPDKPGITQTFSQAGINVELSIQPVSPGANRKGPLVEDENATFQFKLSDAATGNPVSGVHPAAWMDIRQPGESHDVKSCSQKITSYLGQSILEAQPLDLNIYYVIALNDDASITVVDPRFSYGGTRLLAMVALKSPGHDWALTSDERRLFVSMPGSNQLAAVDTASWKVASNIDVGSHPRRIGLQPDEQYVWVADDGAEDSADQSELVAVTVAGLKVAARIPLERGPHDLAFSDDNRFVFVTNRGAGTVSVIDIRKLAKIRDVPVGAAPKSIAFSSVAKLAYVACNGDGVIAAINGDTADVVAKVQAEAGLEQIRFAPGERYGFVVNAAGGKIHVLDVSKNRIIQTASIDAEPDQVTFSGTLAYVRRRKSETLLMIPLSQIGVEGKAIAVADFPGGEHAFGYQVSPSPADNIVKAPEENAVLLANPGDKSIYYYMEGMAAPMGSFSNYGRQPRAVLVVDRSLKERSPGVYTTVGKIGGPGSYDVAFLLSSPRVVNCFHVAVASDPEKEALAAGPAKIEFLLKDSIVKVGATVRLQFKLTDPRTGKPLSGLGDVQVLAFLAPGIWQSRISAKQIGDGTYSAEFVPPRAGIYYIHLGSRSLGLSLNNAGYSVLEAKTDLAGQKQ